MISFQLCSDLEWDSVKMLFKDFDLKTSPYGELFTIQNNQKSLTFFHSGTTKLKAAAGCQYILDKFNPDRHFLIGTSGGVAKSIKKKDIVIAERTAIYDHIYRFGEEFEFIAKDSIKDLNNTWIKQLKFPFDIKYGFVASADQDIDYTVRKQLLKENVLAADWESGAVAIVCDLNKIPCTIIRGITDIPNKGESRDQQNNDYISNTPDLIKKIIMEVVFKILSN